MRLQECWQSRLFHRQSPLSPGVTVSTTQLDFAEGATSSYTIVLDTLPSSSVTISVSASDNPSRCDMDSGASCTRKPGVVTVDKTKLTFKTTDWNTAQTVTVTAADEDMAGVWKFAKIEHQASGGGYDSVSIPDVSVSIADDDTRNIVWHRSTVDGSIGTTGGNAAFWEHQGLVAPESMGFFVSLQSEPTATTTVTVASTDTAVVRLTAGTTLTFGPSDWNEPQRVDVEVTDNRIDEGGRIRTHRVLIDFTLAGAGSDYDGFDADDFFVDVWNNDVAGLTIVPAALAVVEGGQASYTVKLATEPTNTVTVAISGHAGTDLMLDETSLEFTTSTWNDVQTVTVTAGEDTDMSHDTETLTHTASGGGYGSVTKNVVVSEIDNDVLAASFAAASSSADEGPARAT